MKTNNDFHEIDQQASKKLVVDDWSETCQTCNGMGQIYRIKRAETDGKIIHSHLAEPCPNCDGVGEIFYEHPNCL